MAEVFLRQIAGFLRTTTCTMDMVEVFLRQSAGFLSIKNLVEVFLRQRLRVPVSSAPRTQTSRRRLKIMIHEVISKLKTCDSGESSGTREARYIPGVVRPMGSVLARRMERTIIMLRPLG